MTSAGSADTPPKKFWSGIARGFGGSLVFTLPMLMTMEMWWLGFYMDRFRLGLLLVLNLPVLVLISYHSGFEKTLRWSEDLRDAAIAFAIGIIASGLTLLALGIISVGMTADEIVGKIALQSVPASIGALLARSQLGQSEDEPAEAPKEARYLSEVFLMGVGALFLGLNVAPTEEMVLISYKMTFWHALILIPASMALMHCFIYAVEFKGEETLSPDTPLWSSFLRFTVVGYAIAVLISLYVLWTFGRTDGVAVSQTVIGVTVLGFPAAIGAAAARLIL